jgi:hypothetical protein
MVKVIEQAIAKIATLPDADQEDIGRRPLGPAARALEPGAGR